MIILPFLITIISIFIVLYLKFEIENIKDDIGELQESTINLIEKQKKMDRKIEEEIKISIMRAITQIEKRIKETK